MHSKERQKKMAKNNIRYMNSVWSNNHVLFLTKQDIAYLQAGKELIDFVGEKVLHIVME